MKIRIRLARVRSINRKLLSAAGIITLLILNACNDDPTFLGRDLLPASDDIRASFTDDIDIDTYTETSQPVLTSANPSILLGSYYDSIFGYSRADFISRLEVRPTTFETDFLVDSMILSLKFDSFFGDSLNSQTIRIYELTDTLSLDTIYYSDFSPEGKYNPVELASGIISAKDTLVNFYIEDEDLIRRFEEAPDSVFNDPADFYDFFYGFYISTEDGNSPGAIKFLDLTSTDTKFSMYYHLVDSTEALEMMMGIGEVTPKANIFYHDYSNSRVGRFLDMPEKEDTLMYVSSMAGVNTRISFPGIEEWLALKPIAINKARLIIPVEDSASIGIPENQFPPKLSLFSFDQDDSYDFLYDYRIDNSNNKNFFDGNYDPVEEAYAFNIGVHLQSFIQGDIENMNMILVSGQSSLTANRVVLKGPGANERGMELQITYTEF